MPFTFLFAITYNIPKFFELRTHFSVLTHETMIIGSNLRRNPVYIGIYLTWMKIVIMEAIPYVTILTLNILILKQVFDGSKFRSSFRTKSKFAHQNVVVKSYYTVFPRELTAIYFTEIQETK